MAKSPNYNPLSSVGANLGQGKDPDAMGDAEENPHNLMDLTSRNTFDLGYFGGDPEANVYSAVTVGSQITQPTLENKQMPIIIPC